MLGEVEGKSKSQEVAYPLGSFLRHRGRREGDFFFLETLSLMGDWYLQDGNRETQRNYGKGKDGNGSLILTFSVRMRLFSEDIETLNEI